MRFTLCHPLMIQTAQKQNQLILRPGSLEYYSVLCLVVPQKNVCLTAIFMNNELYYIVNEEEIFLLLLGKFHTAYLVHTYPISSTLALVG